jgi:membrane-bound lytic murein transglycosylase D
VSGATPVRTPSAGASSAATPVSGSSVRQASPASTPGATAAASSSGQRRHTVQGGDTLLALAVRYRTSVEALVKVNNLKTPETTLAIGQTLVLP